MAQMDRFPSSFLVPNLNNVAEEKIQFGANEIALVEDLMGSEGLLSIIRNRGIKLARSIVFAGLLEKERKRWSPKRAGQVLEKFIQDGGHLTQILNPAVGVLNAWLAEFENWDSDDEGEDIGPRHSFPVNPRKGEFTVVLKGKPYRLKLGMNQISNVEDMLGMPISQARYRPGVKMTRAILFSGAEHLKIANWTPAEAGRWLQDHMEEGGRMSDIVVPAGQLFAHFLGEFAGPAPSDEDAKKAQTEEDTVNPSSATDE